MKTLFLVLGLILLLLSLIYGFVSAADYRPILIQAIAYGLAASGCFIYSFLKKGKWRHFSLLFLGVALANCLQSADRLAHVLKIY
jgi:hypothetical protein